MSTATINSHCFCMCDVMTVDEHTGSKKLKLSGPDDLPSDAPRVRTCGPSGCWSDLNGNELQTHRVTTCGAELLEKCLTHSFWRSLVPMDQQETE